MCNLKGRFLNFLLGIFHRRPAFGLLVLLKIFLQTPPTTDFLNATEGTNLAIKKISSKEWIADQFNYNKRGKISNNV